MTANMQLTGGVWRVSFRFSSASERFSTTAKISASLSTTEGYVYQHFSSSTKIPDIP
jgi:hypothetical protein